MDSTTEPSIPWVEKIDKTFHWADYLVFGVFLAISLAFGVYYGLFQKQKTAKDFLMGGKDMSVVPVALAIMSSFLSAILILGTPAEMYTQGTMYFMYTFGMMGAVLLATVIFVPLLYPLKLTSSYEYLDKRFNSRSAKLTGTLILFVSQVLYMGIAMFSPATALEAVTGFPTWATIIIGGVVSMLYTAVGGMKASVWASAFQSLVMAAGVIAVIIKASIDVGGIDKVWEINEQNNRVDFFDFNANPLQRHSFWSLIVGGTVGWLSTYGVNQASVQRYAAMPTLNKGRLVVILNIPGLLFFMVICCLAGMGIFAYYASLGCDPLEAGYIDNPNQLIPYFVLDRLDIPGIPGLFLAALFSGALSSISASLAALAAVTWSDVLKDPLKKYDLTDMQQTLINKVLVVIYGGIGIGTAFMAANLGGTVLQASLSFTGAAGGPLLGLFLLGGMFPCANWIGAVSGGLIGLALPLWISMGAYISGSAGENLETNIEYCLNATFVPEPTATIAEEVLSGLDQMYQLSYLWYPSVGAATTVIVGLIVSAVTGCTDPEDVEPKYTIPIFDRIFCCLPNQSLRIMRCKIDVPDADELAKEANAQAYLEEMGADEDYVGKKKKVPTATLR